MEPEAKELIETLLRATQGGGAIDTNITRAGSLVSIAISLKRIADEICGVPYDYAPGADNSKHRAGLTAGIQMAIEQGLAAASQRG